MASSKADGSADEKMQLQKIQEDAVVAADEEAPGPSASAPIPLQGSSPFNTLDRGAAPQCVMLTRTSQWLLEPQGAASAASAAQDVAQAASAPSSSAPPSEPEDDDAADAASEGPDVAERAEKIGGLN